MTPQLRANRIETRRQLAALARHHKWHTTEPHPGRWWLILELHNPEHRIRINVRWIDDQCNATIIDHLTATTWTWANPSVTDLEWLAGNVDTIPAVADLLAHRPAVINLRETA